MHEPLLIELLTEELPPKLLPRLGEAFEQGIRKGLAEQDMLAPDATMTAYATPRRLAVLISQVAKEQTQRTVVRKGPSLKAGLDANQKPTPALMGFARSCGVSVEELKTGTDPKGAPIYLFEETVEGKPLAELLPAILEATLASLPVIKTMRWGNGQYQFVRPVHGLMVLLGSEVLPVSVMGLDAGRSTRGHRFLGQGQVNITHANDYARALKEEGFVLASFEERRKAIQSALATAAGSARPLAGEDLLSEVTALVEWPMVYQGSFSPEFLAVPQECLILSMQQHQKYFPLGDQAGVLQPGFLVVSNLETKDPSPIVRGNERVLRARLSDARFFFDQDRKTTLASRVERLKDVVYHNRLGSLGQRVERLQHLAGQIAPMLGASSEDAKRAAFLMKADLVTDMVGEFPELQGIMGRHYALHDGENPAVANAIEEHYHPRFANDSLPASPLGFAVALADKLELLAGFFSISQIPTGDRDPFGLRRATLGVLRMLMESPQPLELSGLLALALGTFPAAAPSAASDLDVFVQDRLKGLLRERGFGAAEVEAVAGTLPNRLDLLVPRLEALRSFQGLSEAQALCAANKRIRNILKKTEVSGLALQDNLLELPAEQALAQALYTLEPEISAYLEHQDFVAALCQLARLQSVVDQFFNDVMVMAEDVKLRHNRLALLERTGHLMNQVADISHLDG
jgi:glycyl-tRNA synthetase beta chain